MSGASDLCAFLRMSRSTASRSMGGAGAGDHLSSTNSLQLMALQGNFVVILPSAMHALISHRQLMFH